MNFFLIHLLGLNNLSGPWYGFWSGFGSDLTEFAILGLLWRKLNCHAKGCYRVGLHHVPGTGFVTCRKHHPTINDNSVAAIHKAHKEAK